MHSDLPGGLLLLKAEIESTLQNVVSDVLELLGVAGNRPRRVRSPPKSGVRNSEDFFAVLFALVPLVFAQFASKERPTRTRRRQISLRQIHCP